MSNQPNFFTQNIIKKIYLYSVLLICSLMFLCKGNGLIANITNYYYCMFNSDIEFEEYVSEEKRRISCGGDNKNISVFYQNLDDQQLEIAKKDFGEKELSWKKKNILRESCHAIFILIFAFFHLLILRKDA